MVLCAGCQTKEASRLECPHCKKLGIAGSFFCDQDCFKTNSGERQLTWQGRRELTPQAKHKLIHNIVQIAAEAEETRNSTLPPAMRNYQFTGPLRPVYPLSARREVPAHVQRPDYADHPQGFSPSEAVRERAPKILTEQEIAKSRKVCRLTREVLDLVASHIRPGVTTDELDAICHQACIDRDSYPSPLNYVKFPKSICTSVNEVICHGIPDQRPLVEGDIVNLDVSLYHDGFHGDVNATYPVGKCDQESLDLIAGTKKSMDEAIKICKPGVPFREIGNKIDEVIRPLGYSIVRRYTGHGVNQLFHGLPTIVHYAGSKTPGKMEPGMVFTIEPMINLGTANLDHWKDDWTAVTLDGRRSAQFEETILITETGCEILTRPAAPKKKKKKSKAKAGANGAAGTGASTPADAEADDDEGADGAADAEA